MIVKVEVPKWGLTMEKADVVKWLKNEGEKVEKGEHLVELMTEKISNFVEAPESGILKKIYAKEGDEVKVGELLAEIETEEI